MPTALPRTRKVSVVVSITALGIVSSYESVTAAACEYRQLNVYPYLTSKGFHVTLLQGPMARRHYAAPEAKKTEVDYFTGVGHGAYNHFLS